MEKGKNSLLHHARLKQILNDVPLLFRNFPPQDFREFLLRGTLKEYESGQVIFSETDGIINNGWLIADGTISLYLEDVFVGRLTTGDFMGETFLFKKQPVSGSVFAVKPTAIIQFEKEKVIHFFEERSDRLFKIFVLNLIELQSKKLDYAARKILQMQQKLKSIGN